MDGILEADEACKYLRISKVTLFREVRSGKIPAIKVGRQWKFSKSMLESWLITAIKEDTSTRYKAHLRRIEPKAKIDRSCAN